MNRESLLISALLHDIGKFWQGTGKSGTHVELGREFLTSYVPEKWRNVGVVVGHHDRNKYLSEEYVPLKIVTVADWLSSWERKELEEREEGKRKTTPLRSLFPSINIGKGESPRKYYSLKILDMKKDTIFPSEPPDSASLINGYEHLWHNFVEEVKQCERLADFESYFETLYRILEKYTWCVPSSVWKDVPDISLFNHLKTTCAIASCLYQSDVTYLDNVIGSLRKRFKIEEDLKSRGLKGEELLQAIEEKFSKEVDKQMLEYFEKEVFLLIGGDISGVQKFIYSITSKGAAKGLRGRSLYLQFLCETIARYIARELDLPITNIIFCGGGHFYILAPKEAESLLDTIHTQIAEKLLQIHRGALYLALSETKLGAKDFEPVRFSEKWKEVGEKLAVEKERKFHKILDAQHYKDIFGPIDEGGSGDTCDVCGVEAKLIPDPEDPEIRKCAFCHSVEGLAKEISKADTLTEIILRKEIELEGEVEGWKSALSKFGILYELGKVNEKSVQRTYVDRIVINSINTTDLPYDLGKSAKISTGFGFKFILNAPPREFDGLSKNATGDRKWAVLRMDVDNLGKIFSDGLGEDRTISRISTLSYLFSLYFNGWIHKICMEHKDHSYGIYSGGDDLFIVCSWHAAPEIAKEIMKSFREFTCYNPNITISAGISIAPSVKFPIHRMADMAKNALDEGAKNLCDKDGMDFLGRSVKWRCFEEEVIPLKNSLLKLIEGKGVSRALLQKLYSIYRVYEKQKSLRGKTAAKYDDRYGRWRWLLAYTIARTKVPKEQVDTLEDVHKKVKDYIDYVPISTRWVELLTRQVVR